MSELRLNTDGHIIKFGADNDVSLTHVADTGLLLNSTMQLQFNDASQNINAPSATVLDINATDEIELNATAVDLNGTLDVSGTLTQTGVATFTARDIHSSGITIANAGEIGSVGDADSMAIASNGVVTFTQAPVFPDGSLAVADLDIDGATDIGAAIVDADLFIVDDGAGGTNRKVTASRIKTYAGASGAITGITSVLNAALVVGRDADNNINFGTDDNITFETGGVENMRLQSAGKLFLNHTETISTGTTHQLQVAKNNTAASMVVHAGLNTDGAGNYTLSKSRHATPGSSTIVNNADVLGSFRWIAADGNDLTCIAAAIDARVDGTPGQDDIPTRMGFAVAPDGANSPTERFRISQNGDLTATDTGIGSLSDERMKENVADFTYNINTFKTLKPRTFTWKNPAQHNGSGTKRGFIAQELGAVDNTYTYTYALNKDDDDYDLIYNSDGSLLDDSKGEALSAKLGSKDAMYVSVIKQLITRIEALEG